MFAFSWSCVYIDIYMFVQHEFIYIYIYIYTERERGGRERKRQRKYLDIYEKYLIYIEIHTLSLSLGWCNTNIHSIAYFPHISKDSIGFINCICLSTFIYIYIYILLFFKLKSPLHRKWCLTKLLYKYPFRKPKKYLYILFIFRRYEKNLMNITSIIYTYIYIYKERVRVREREGGGGEEKRRKR